MINIKNYIKFIRDNELLVVSSVILFIVFILTGVLLIPNFIRAKEIFTAKSVVEFKYNKLKKKNLELAKLDNNFYEETLPKIVKLLPNEKDYVSLFTTLDELQNRTGVSIRKTDFQLGLVSTRSAQLVKAKDIDVYTVGLSLNIIGEDTQVYKFIDNLSNLTGRFISIEEISWDGKSDDIISASIRGNAYFYPFPDKLNPIDSPLPVLTDKQNDILSIVSKSQLPDLIDSTQVVILGKGQLF